MRPYGGRKCPSSTSVRVFQAQTERARVGPFRISVQEALRLRRRVFLAPNWCRFAGVQAIDARVALRLANRAIHVADVALELTNAFPDRGADLGNPSRAEDHEHDDEDDEQLHGAEIS